MQIKIFHCRISKTIQVMNTCVKQDFTMKNLFKVKNTLENESCETCLNDLKLYKCSTSKSPLLVVL